MPCQEIHANWACRRWRIFFEFLGVWLNSSTSVSHASPQQLMSCLASYMSSSFLVRTPFISMTMESTVIIFLAHIHAQFPQLLFQLLLERGRHNARAHAFVLHEKEKHFCHASSVLLSRLRLDVPTLPYSRGRARRLRHHPPRPSLRACPSSFASCLWFQRTAPLKSSDDC